MRYELETPGGRHVPYVADSVTFEGGGVQFWRLVEQPQTPPRRDLLAAWAPQAWVKLWPTEVNPQVPAPVGLDWPPRPLLPHVYTPADINEGWCLPCCDRPREDPVHDADLVVDRREDEDGERS